MHSPSLLIPTAIHFFSLQYWHLFLFTRMMLHCWFFKHGRYWIFCWILLRKKPYNKNRNIIIEENILQDIVEILKNFRNFIISRKYYRNTPSIGYNTHACILKTCRVAYSDVRNTFIFLIDYTASFPYFILIMKSNLLHTIDTNLIVIRKQHYAVICKKM